MVKCHAGECSIRRLMFLFLSCYRPCQGMLQRWPLQLCRGSMQ
jgi:hypothetical protein